MGWRVLLSLLKRFQTIAPMNSNIFVHFYTFFVDTLTDQWNPPMAFSGVQSTDRRLSMGGGYLPLRFNGIQNPLNTSGHLFSGQSTEL